MDAKVLLKACEEAGIDLFTGVPDSQLAGLCDTLYARFGTDGSHHVVAANEGNAIGLAAGHYLATGKPALVYMQNSGLGNAVNPLASLMDEEVYGIPCLLVIGWRGEPTVKDEPQHVKQGKITLSQLEVLGVSYQIIDKATTETDFAAIFTETQKTLQSGHTTALVIRKGGLTCEIKPVYVNPYPMTRERAAEILLEEMNSEDIVVSTTGKLSREIFELREKRQEGHQKDFLTVGSMGHASSIAMGIALEKPSRTVWCLDGDGAAVMHLGAMDVLGQRNLPNMKHVVINNGAHETVGGMPVCSGQTNFCALAEAAGYPLVLSAGDEASLRSAMKQIKDAECLCFLEVRCALGARSNLGRPTTTPKENRDAFMSFVMEAEKEKQP